ncbi:MAG: hypothetical protein IPJ04_13760 [Candidatus Eisenbacteria bacterium]|nr:hypothetical protein [Candidatus Eisenbacteria bacterium]
MSRLGITASLVLAASLVAASAALAQTDPPAAAADSTASSAPIEVPAVDSTVALPPTPPAVPAAPESPSLMLGANSPRPVRPHQMTPRTESAIRQELDQYAITIAAADVDFATAKKRRGEAKATVEIKKREIDVMEARVKAAKQAKDEPTRLSFEGEKKRQESMREFFQKTEDVEEAALDEARARSEWARAATRAAQFEMSLIGRAGVAVNDSDGGLFKQEQQWFEARKLAAAAQERHANKVQTWMDRKAKLYRAWADFLAGK